MSENTGIALFAFNRPELLQHSLAALANNISAEKFALVVFVDGARNELDEMQVAKSVQVAKSAQQFKSLNVVVRERNYGCANSIIAGITESFRQFSRLAIFEDDIITSPHTINFLHCALEKYESKSSVFSISAWSPPPTLLRVPDDYSFDAYFTARCNVWGWATWRDRWEQIDWDVNGFDALVASKSLQRGFNIGGNDLTPMLYDQMFGRIDAWDIRMDFTRFRLGCVALNPRVSFTTNIGMGSGTHTTELTTKYDNDVSLALSHFALPDFVFCDPLISNSFRSVYDSQPLYKRVIDKVKRTIRQKVSNAISR